MCMFVHLFIAYLLCSYWMIMLHWYNTWIIWLERIKLLYYWFTPPLSNPIETTSDASIIHYNNNTKKINIIIHIAQSTSRHRIYVVHPSVGLRPPTSSSSLLVFNLLTFLCSCAQSHRAKLRRGQEICALRTRSSFPKSGQGTKTNSY